MSADTKEAPEDIVGKKFKGPRLRHPRMMVDGIAWLRVYFRRIGIWKKTVDTDFYGVNIWRVRKKKLIQSISLVLKLSGNALQEQQGKLHHLEYIKDPDSDHYNVIVIYRWNALQEQQQVPTPPTILIGHFKFIKVVDAYNWTFTTEPKDNLSDYADMLDHNFHPDFLFDRDDK